MAHYKGEKYYVPSFPIISDKDKEALKPTCEKIGSELFLVFEHCLSVNLIKGLYKISNIWRRDEVIGLMAMAMVQKYQAG